jgi:hypothetical protein
VQLNVVNPVGGFGQDNRSRRVGAGRDARPWRMAHFGRVPQEGVMVFR